VIHRTLACTLGLATAALLAPALPLDGEASTPGRQDNVPIQILSSTQNMGETRPCG
jgi:hypothetical protein